MKADFPAWAVVAMNSGASSVRARLAYSRFTWQGLENASIHVSMVLMVVYAAAMAAVLIGRPELRYSIAYFA